MKDQLAREQLVDVCRRLYNRHLTVSAGGNMSMRLTNGHILITPSGVNKGSVTPNMLVEIDINGNKISGGKPSIEHRFHLGLYRANPKNMAVIHCHPLYCLALAISERNIRSCMTPEGVLLLGRVPTIRYETPGSDELVEAVMEHSDSPVMLMSKHGAISQGKTLDEAFNRMEELEFQAHLQLLAPDAPDLPDDEITRLTEMR